MSKFIKVTSASTGETTLQNAATVEFFSDQMMVCLDGSNLEIKESLEQIEAQLLRDEFAKAALTGILGNSSIDNLEAKDVAHDSYIFADAMLKERLK